MSKVLSLLISIPFIVSCTNESLTSEEAKTILQQNFNVNCLSRRIVNMTSTSDNEHYNKFYPKFKQLEEQGLFEISIKKWSDYAGREQNFNLIPTERIKSDLMEDNQYIVAKAEIIQILGISMNKEMKTATVLFTYKFVPTALFDLKTADCGTANIEQEMEFVKYDTGWKLKQPKNEVQSY